MRKVLSYLLVSNDQRSSHSFSLSILSPVFCVLVTARLDSKQINPQHSTMEETKENATVTQFPTDEENPFDQHVTPEKKGSPEDQRDMYRMGKAQELRV